MDYTSHYIRLIDRAKNRQLDGYYEIHHIIPRCMGGSNNQDNLVNLTAREHFIAHLLLVKIYSDNYKLIKAAAMMCVGQTERKISNRLYEHLRKKLSHAQSICQTASGNSQYGSQWVNNPVTKEDRKIKSGVSIPDGWQRGRYKVPKIKTNTHDKKLLDSAAKARELWSKYKDGNYQSIRDFCRLGEYEKSHVSLTNLWKKYINEYKVLAKQGQKFNPG